MNRKRWSLALAAGLAAAVAALPLAASGQSGGKVMIAERNMFTGQGTQAGTFAIAGAFTDSGAATATFTLTPRGDARMFLDGDHVLQGRRGTLVIRTHAMVYVGSPPTAYVDGSWKVVDGTGAYAGIQGGGIVKAVGDFENGTATIVREGAVNGGGA